LGDLSHSGDFSSSHDSSGTCSTFASLFDVSSHGTKVVIVDDGDVRIGRLIGRGYKRKKAVTIYVMKFTVRGGRYVSYLCLEYLLLKTAPTVDLAALKPFSVVAWENKV